MAKEKIYLMIIDGFGEGKNYKGNAVKKAKLPNIDRLKKQYPFTLLKAAGNAVGLPEGVQGNSEVGHYTIGVGRVVYQSLEEINLSIKNGSFFKKKAFLQAMEKVKKGDKAALHLIGLISDEGVHAHTDHLFALLKLAKEHKVGPVYIHAITDGRDVEERSAGKYIKMIQDKIKQLKLEDTIPHGAHIASIIGRYYAMDRDSNWDRTRVAYDLYTLGKGATEKDPLKAIKNAYAAGTETDYYIKPIILDKHGVIKDKDSIIFFNFRTDRPRQLTQAFTGETKIGFKPQKTVRPFLVCFGAYTKKAHVVFPPPIIKNNLGSVIEQKKLKQLHIAETEKYAHVTYFFNSQVEKPFKNETRILIKSPKVPSYDQKPEMSAPHIAQRILKELNRPNYDLIVQNFANPDLVGHSGNLPATIKACEVIDDCVGRIAEKCLKKGYNLIITADHGNAEYMIYEKNGDPCPSHTTNKVPFILVSSKLKNAKLRGDCGLSDIAPTILDIMDIRKPTEMKGKSLIIKK
ncbi:2,3-bisphosphoglycerate-independent phosphoglycerate mutase [Patescibacteria group bacterium]|nr:2,3-bisphosphoglycerate-independent phosphoglycerate mutase [Patescibacteria group bacterium]MBU1703544.1 2,3-bisphosphoglycerate-independent phosphoglycerate mutase [Patescibacteria group bacterium]MBU1953880.1 2,3-bisphosphoglycerate-independent phosphoglycerate mutase [Patescibacteria group bacterium]